MENSRPEEELRLWVAACASGEEAYTLAIELSEVIREQDRDCRFRIIATDVHKRSIQRAAAGIYREELVAKLTPDLRERYFVEHREGVMVDPAIRQRVIFSVHDALRDPPFMRLDLISCRNLLIYLDEGAQQRILSMFLFGLRKNGFLYLGTSESLGHRTDDFAVVDSKSRIFRKTSDRRTLDDSMLSGSVPARTPLQPRAPAQQSRPPLTSVDGDQSARRDRDGLLRGYDALLKRYAPSSILVSSNGTVLTWFGAASAYIDTMSNLAEWTVEEIVHPSLRYTINIAAERFRRKDQAAFVREVVVDEGTPQQHRLKVEVEAIGKHGDGGRFLLVTLHRLGEDSNEAAGQSDAIRNDAQLDDNAVLADRVRELERDLRLTEESLQYVTERLEASGEELQASNEELQASNEELQASNEEMQSANEELQAVNEEMLSVSTEHERKIELLSELNHDTELIFEMLNVGVMVLDADLKVIRFTGLCARMFEL